jgi:hypothetical protein
MPNDIPPAGERPDPRYVQLPAGSFLWRVARPRGAVAPVFRPFPAAPGSTGISRSGRFDPAADCPYSYCYAALDDLTALCETLLRDFGFDGPVRYLPEQEIAGRRLSILETRAPLWLVSLVDAADLAAARQDSWLLHADQTDYRITRRWAHWLRDSPGPDGASPPAGLVWRSKREPGGRAVLLFGDRCADAVVVSPFGDRPLDGPDGTAWLNRRLELLRTKVAPGAGTAVAGTAVAGMAAGATGVGATGVAGVGGVGSAGAAAR